MKEPSCTSVGTQNGAATVENSVGVLKKSEMKLPYCPALPLLGILLGHQKE